MTGVLPCPYKGPETFAFADRPLYFGRDRARRLVRTRIEAQPAFVLTGPSGCGKSSLLRTGILPDLLSAGWAVAYALPGNAPEAAMAKELARQAYPGEAQEHQAVAAVQAHAVPKLASLGSSPLMLSDIRTWFAALSPADGARQAICGSEVEGAASKVQRLPFLAQAVAGLLDDDALRCRFGARRQPTRALGWDEVEALVEGLPDPAPQPTNLQDAVGAFMEQAPARGYCGLVLVLDQAEELFTRYRGPVAGLRSTTSNAPTSQARVDFFQAITDLAELTFALPLRICVCLRPEWFTRLRTSLPDLDLNELAVHHLELLTREEASAALLQPARLLDVEFSEQCAEQLLNGLVEDDRIDPFLLAITGELVWAACEPREGRQITWSDVRFALKVRPGQSNITGAALECLLDKVLLHQDTPGRFDMLEMLGRLATEDGTRLFREREELVARPLRRPERLEQALNDLELSRLVRTSELTGQDGRSRPHVEVRHDRLLAVAGARLRKLQDGEWNAGHGDGPARAATLLDESGQTRSRVHLRSALPGVLDLIRMLRVSPLDIYAKDFAGRLPDYAREVLRTNLDLLELDSTLALLLLAGLLEDAQEYSTSSPGDWTGVLRTALDGARRSTGTGNANDALGRLEWALCSASPATVVKALQAIPLQDPSANRFQAKPQGRSA